MLREIFKIFVTVTLFRKRNSGWPLSSWVRGGNIYACRLTRRNLFSYLFLIYKLVLVRSGEGRPMLFTRKKRDVNVLLIKPYALSDPQHNVVIITPGGLHCPNTWSFTSDKSSFMKEPTRYFFSISLTDKTILQTILPHRKILFKLMSVVVV